MLVRRITLFRGSVLLLAAIVATAGGGAVQPGGKATAAPSTIAKKDQPRDVSGQALDRSAQRCATRDLPRRRIGVARHGGRFDR